MPLVVEDEGHMDFASRYRAAIGAPPTPAGGAAQASDQARGSQGGSPSDPGWGNAPGVCEATFAALSMKVMQAGPMPREIELHTALSPRVDVSWERLAHLYTQRLGGGYRVTALVGEANPKGGMTLHVRVEK